MSDNYDITIPENLSPEDAAKQVPEFISNSIVSLRTIQQRIQETQKKAEDAKEEAEEAWLVKVGFWHSSTPALEALQKAGKCQSEAVIGISECQELLFKQQYILAQCTKYLFMLCCANLANAKIAVNEIRMRLQEASEDEISEMARNELQKTMHQLKQQIDLLEQQERLKSKVDKIESKLKTLESFLSKPRRKGEIPVFEPSDTQEPTGDTFSQNNFSDCGARKVCYIILAIILGALGIHDFYAGKTFRGIAKMCISLLSVGTLCWVPIIWSVIDIVIACKDEEFFSSKWHSKK